jgi:sugar/nucleoside kinase (ribokinase family)
VTGRTLDIIAIGNAIVDVIAQADDAFLGREGIAKGSMRLIDPDTAEGLYSRMGPGREISGGSAANTVAGVAALGARCGFIGQVADDQLGAVFAHDIRAQGIDFDVPARDASVPTGRCLILVSKDGQRTMNTYLGAAQFLPPDAVDEEVVRNAAILLLEGYLWDPPEPREAMKRAIRMAHKSGGRVALGVSAVFCIDNHRADFMGLLDAGDIDILFANEEEVLALTQLTDFDQAIDVLAAKVPLVVATRGADGAIAVQGGTRVSVPAEPAERIVDTTGAGDLFAAGFLAGHVQGRSIQDSLTIGAIAAAEVISHYGARPEADLRELVKARLG